MCRTDQIDCAICGRLIEDTANLYQDFDKLGNPWSFHHSCFDRFNNKEYKRKKD